MRSNRTWPEARHEDPPQSGGSGGRGNRRGAESGPDPYAGTREEMDRAIRRLDALEWVILFTAVGFALGGGALVAWILSSGTDLSFRALWAGLSVLLLLIPGALVFIRERFR